MKYIFLKHTYVIVSANDIDRTHKYQFIQFLFKFFSICVMPVFKCSYEEYDIDLTGIWNILRPIS